jgi:predicted aspartyl protease
MLGLRPGLISLLFGISIAVSPAATAKERPVQAPSTEGAVRFDLYQGYLMVAKGSIGPLKGLHFLLDTGTSTTLLDPRIASELNLEGVPEDVNMIFVDGRVLATHTWAPSIELGPIRQFHRPVLIQDLSAFNAALPVRVDAVIGLDVLGKSPFEVDYRNRKIHFGDLPHLPISIPMSMEQGLAMVNVEVNHATAHLVLDTGTPSLLIFGSRIPKAIAGLKVYRPQRDATNARGSLERKEVHLPSIQLGEVEFFRKQAILVESRDEGGRDFDGVLSPAALGIEAFAVDPDRGALELRLGM